MPEHAHLTDLEQLLLLGVLRLGDGAYGAAIQNHLEQYAQRTVSLGSIHVTLARLEERGIANSELARPRSMRGGRARRVYGLTEAGRGALEWNRQILERMWEGLPAEEAR